MIRSAAEAFLAAVQTQADERGATAKVHRQDGDLRDVQIIGSIDVLAAIRVAVATLRVASDEMEEAGSAYVDQSQHVEVDGIWTAMMDAALRPGSAR
jgi:hypothetical protein